MFCAIPFDDKNAPFDFHYTSTDLEDEETDIFLSLSEDEDDLISYEYNDKLSNYVSKETVKKVIEAIAKYRSLYNS